MTPPSSDRCRELGRCSRCSAVQVDRGGCRNFALIIVISPIESFSLFVSGNIVCTMGKSVFMFRLLVGTHNERRDWWTHRHTVQQRQATIVKRLFTLTRSVDRRKRSSVADWEINIHAYLATSLWRLIVDILSMHLGGLATDGLFIDTVSKEHLIRLTLVWILVLPWISADAYSYWEKISKDPS